jgi:hypothetical protein
MPTTPPPTCHKCGQPAPDDAANRSAWLIAQRKGAPDGYMIVRCPDHITKHALMLAGLPQQDSRERIQNLLDRGVEYEVEPGHYIRAGKSERVYYTQKRFANGPVMNFVYYYTIDQLLTAMRTIQPDMRRWKIAKD